MDTTLIDDTVVVERLACGPGPLRVAVVTETWPPEVNGVALTIERIVGGLKRRGHRIQLVRPRQGDVDPAAGRDTADTVLTPGLPIPRYPSLRLGVPQRRTLVRLWSGHRPDVVHLTTEGPLGWSALQAARHLRLPVTSDFRTNFHAYSAHYGAGFLARPIAAYLRRFHNRTDVTTVPTERLRRELDAAGFRRLEVVGRGVDTERFSPRSRNAALRRSWGVDAADAPVVIGIGRLAPEKNLWTLLRAYDAIRSAEPRARLLLVGDGPLRAALQSLRPDAIFAGQRSGEDLAAHIASADLCLFPSLTETYGNVTAEAMASGLAVVAFDYAAAAQLIDDGVSGRRVPRGNDVAFLAAAVEVGSDARRRAEMGRRARSAVEPLGWDDVVARFETVLRRVAGQHA